MRRLTWKVGIWLNDGMQGGTQTVEEEVGAKMLLGYKTLFLDQQTQVQGHVFIPLALIPTFSSIPGVWVFFLLFYLFELVSNFGFLNKAFVYY